MAHFRNLHKENSSEIPSHWIYQSINPIFKLLLASQTLLDSYNPTELELFCDISIAGLSCKRNGYIFKGRTLSKLFHLPSEKGST